MREDAGQVEIQLGHLLQDFIGNVNFKTIHLLPVGKIMQS